MTHSGGNDDDDGARRCGAPSSATTEGVGAKPPLGIASAPLAT